MTELPRMYMTKTAHLFRLLLLSCVFAHSVRLHADVQFSGLSPEQEQNARALMPLASTSCDSAPWRVDRLFQDSDSRLGRALQALGYYHYTIAKSLQWTEDCWHAQLDVTPGEPVRLRTVEITITGDAARNILFAAVTENGRPASGEQFDHGQYERFKSRLLSAAFSLGFFDAAFERKEVVVDREAFAADLYLDFDSGKRYRVGEISFTQGIIKDHIVAGYFDLQTGDAYRSKAVADLLQGLNSSSYFDSVTISTEPLDHEAKTVPITVSMTPGKRQAYTIGVGYSSDTGPQGRLGYVDRRRNENGHQLESRLFGSPVKSELTFAYRLPRGDPRKEWLSLSAGFQHSETDTSQSDTFKMGVLHTEKRSEKWLESRYVDYVDEDFIIGAQDDSSRLFIFGIGWESVTGRELSRTSKGRRYNFDVRGASDSLGSDTSFLQFKASSRWIHSLSDQTRLLTRARLGTTLHDEFTALPASVRFFTGGDRSVRGYGFETLGPLDQLGTVTGGSHLVEASVELERMIKDQWSVALFADTGSAFNGTDINLSSGIGLGVRWYSPVGPIRLDFAHPLDQSSRSIRLHFSLGPDL